MDVLKKYYYLLFLFLLSIPYLSFSAKQETKHEFHHPQKLLSQLKNDPKAGEKVYNHFCKTCHAKDPMISVGAPPIHNKAAWKPRMKKGNDEMFKVINKGIGAMPPRGGCFECTDDELKAAIVFMLPLP